jgi:hypothetical protein
LKSAFGSSEADPFEPALDDALGAAEGPGAEFEPWA